MSDLIITPISVGRSITSTVTMDNVQEVCDHVKAHDDLLLVENAFGAEIEEKIKQDGLKTGSVQTKGVQYRVIYKEG